MAPPLPGDVPPTIFVPYAIACSEWNVPFLPVKPWQMTLVSLSIRMDMTLVHTLHCLDDLLRGVVEIVGRGDVDVGFRDDFFTKLHIRAFEPHDERHPQAHLLHRRDHAVGDDIA